nr:hypothetical protein [Agrobacterium sp. AGB01]
MSLGIGIGYRGYGEIECGNTHFLQGRPTLESGGVSISAIEWSKPITETSSGTRNLA